MAASEKVFMETTLCEKVSLFSIAMKPCFTYAGSFFRFNMA